jgi:hypothetical protein
VVVDARAIGIEFRAHIENPVWQGFFEVIFSVSESHSSRSSWAPHWAMSSGECR